MAQPAAQGSQRRARALPGQQRRGTRSLAPSKQSRGSPKAFMVPLALWPPGRIRSNSDSPFQKGEAQFPSHHSIAVMQVYLTANSHLPGPPAPDMSSCMEGTLILKAGPVSATPPHPEMQQKPGRCVLLQVGFMALQPGKPPTAKVCISYSHSTTAVQRCELGCCNCTCSERSEGWL